MLIADDLTHPPASGRIVPFDGRAPPGQVDDSRPVQQLNDQFHISGAKSVSARVLELKSAAEGSLTALYCVDIRFAMDAKKLTPVMSTYYFSADLN